MDRYRDSLVSLSSLFLSFVDIQSSEQVEEGGVDCDSPAHV